MDGVLKNYSSCNIVQYTESFYNPFLIYIALALDHTFKFILCYYISVNSGVIILSRSSFLV